MRPRPLTFHEQYFKEVPTSGGVILGAQAEPGTTSVLGDEIWFSVPNMTRIPPKLCVAVSSDDGRYEASAEYEVPSPAKGPFALSFPTKYKGRIATYGPTRLAILGTLQSDCSVPAADGAETVLALLSWSKFISVDRFVLKVNSGGATSIKLFTTDDHAYTDCKALGNPTQSIAFDTVCTGKLQNGQWRGFLVRKRYEIRLADIPLWVITQ